MKSPMDTKRQPLREAVFKQLPDLQRIVRKWSSRGAFAILDQGLISGSNFVVTILLARWLTPQQYGAYALAFEIFLFLSAMYAALMMEPMAVYGASIYHDSFGGYLGGLLRIHCVVSFVITALLFGAAAVAHVLRPASLLPEALVGVSIAAPCLLLFWLGRRGFYVVFLPQIAVLGAGIYGAILLAGVTLLDATKSLSPLSAFLLLAAASVVTGPILFRWLKARQVPIRRDPSLREIIRKHWTYGRWAVANSGVGWLSSALYYPLLGGFFTLAEAGKFKALMNLSSPIAQVFVAISLLALPLAARTHNQDGRAVTHRLVWRMTAVYLGGTSLYWAALLVLRAPVVHYLYGGKYMQVMSLLPWVALGSVLRISATSQAIALKGMRSPQSAFVAYGSGCIVAVLLGVPATRWFGIRGVLFSWVLTGAAVLVGTLLMVRRMSLRSDLTEAAAAEALTVREEVSLSAEG